MCIHVCAIYTHREKEGETDRRTETETEHNQILSSLRKALCPSYRVMDLEHVLDLAGHELPEDVHVLHVEVGVAR